MHTNYKMSKRVIYLKKNKILHQIIVCLKKGKNTKLKVHQLGVTPDMSQSSMLNSLLKLKNQIC